MTETAPRTPRTGRAIASFLLALCLHVVPAWLVLFGPLYGLPVLKTILLLNPVYVTLFWAVVLNLHYKVHHAPKAFLGKFMIVAFLVYFAHFLYFSELWAIYTYLDSIYIFASLLVFPLYHIYIRLLTTERKFSMAVHGKYLVFPLMVFLLFLPGVLIMDHEAYTDFLRRVIYDRQPDSGIQQYMFLIYHLARVVFVAQVIWYLYANFRLIIRNNKQLQDFYSNTEDRKLQWVQFFNISLAITSLASIFVALTGRETFFRGDWSLAGPSLVFSLMLFFIGLLGNVQNPVHIHPGKDEKENLPNLKEEEKEEEKAGFIADPRLKKGMEQLFEKEMVFKNQDLKIWDISQMLGTNRTYVSRYINAEYNRNFCNHVNHYRVKYAKKLLADNPALSNEQIAELSGFGSQNSLYRAFQAAEGFTFGHYRKKSMPTQV